MVEPKIIYCLDSSAEGFAGWLRHVTASASSHLQCPSHLSVRHGGGRYVLLPASLPSAENDPRPSLNLEMRRYHEPVGAPRTAAPPTHRAISFQVNTQPARPRPIELTLAYHVADVAEYVEELAQAIGWQYPARGATGPDARQVTATTERVQALKARISDAPARHVRARATLQGLDRFLKGFLAAHRTELRLRTLGASCWGVQLWWVETPDGRPVWALEAIPNAGGAETVTPQRLNLSLWRGRDLAETAPGDRPCLEGLLEALQRNGMIQPPPSQPAAKIDLQQGQPGRKPDPLYDEAYRRIRAGQPQKDVFAWFCQQAQINKPDKGMRDAFKAALKRRQNKA